MERLNHPVYRNRTVQFAADALLCAFAFGIAFLLRFADTPNGIPPRYEEMLLGSIAFVALGKAVLFGALGLHQKWWRYFGLRDLWPIVRAAALATAALVVVFTVARPFGDELPRSVVVLDFMLTLLFVAGRGWRCASRSSGRRAPGAGGRRTTCSWSAPAPAARWWSASFS